MTINESGPREMLPGLSCLLAMDGQVMELSREGTRVSALVDDGEDTRRRQSGRPSLRAVVCTLHACCRRCEESLHPRERTSKRSVARDLAVLGRVLGSYVESWSPGVDGGRKTREES
jgi:hypothetical protein